MADAVSRGHIAGDGVYTQKCRALLEQALGVPRALLTTSCTHALEVAALLLELEPEDEVIVPSFTFVSTVNPFVLRRARPVFIDIRPDTLNLDETLLERAITSKTQAVVVVHYAGVACEMEAIADIAARHDIPVIEDNAHGLFAKYNDQYLGTFGCLAAQSFHETKNFSCGEGGALLINDLQLIERAEIIREKGTNRSQFFRGQVDKYTWVSEGSSFLPSDLLAAFLYAQLEARDVIQTRRMQIWNTYFDQLQDWADNYAVQLPVIPEYCDHPAHIFYLILPSLERRQTPIAHLKAAGIQSVFHYLPLHLSAMGKRFGGYAGQFPVTERIGDCLLRLPLYAALTDEEVHYIVTTIKRFTG
jgi:dTDP-4-amino-4,6-dideoxygalactose transaminase